MRRTDGAGELGVLENRRATIYPGMEDKLKGAEYIDIPSSKGYQYNHISGTGTAMQLLWPLWDF